MSYALATLWYDRQRYLPGILAVAFSGLLLIALQCGLLFGLLSVTSIPIDRSNADIWIGSQKVLSVDIGQAISESRMTARIGSMPGVVKVEPYIQRRHVGKAQWRVGSLHPDRLPVRRRLDRAGASLGCENARRSDRGSAVVVDESELDRLDVSDAAELLKEGKRAMAKINGKPVRVVGLVSGMKSIAGPYVFCSLYTARNLARMGPDQNGVHAGEMR